MHIPVIVGVADITNRTKHLRDDGSDEPASLILQAIEAAFQDAGQGSSGSESALSSSKLDSISIVRPWSWPYADLPKLLAQRLKSDGVRYTTTSPDGGNQPAKLLDEACRRISKGESELAVVAGGEALASLEEYIKAQQVPPPGWTEVEDYSSLDSDALRPPEGDSLKGKHGIGAPIQIYALYENALRAHLKQSYFDNHDESSTMYAEFAQVSKEHPASWHYGKADSKETIGTVGGKNRMINTPYPMLMCAFNKVNIAGACLVTSEERALAAGINKSKLVYVLGGAGTAESDEFYMRTAYHESPAIQQSIDAALTCSGVSRDSIDLYDFYSCFPVVPKLACRHLGLRTTSPQKPITLLGGLTSFGGAGNNYSMHAIGEMTRQLRKGKAQKSLVLANGGFLSYQHALVLSAQKGSRGYPEQAPLPEHCDELSSELFDEVVPGSEPQDATIEAYTVDYTRRGEPRRGHVIGRLVRNNHRFIANHADASTLAQLASTNGKEIVGRRGRVFQDKGDDATPGHNVFTLHPNEKL